MNPNNNVTLVMTSAVKSVDPYLTIGNSDERLFQLNCSLISWITSSRVDNIILCDNTALSNKFFGLVSLAKQYDKQLEVLSFDGDSSRVATHGKGFGEGEIIEYVLGNSSLIKNGAVFYKVTGRVFVENFDTICNQERQHDVVFDLKIKPTKKFVWKCLAVIPGLGTLLTNNGFGFVKTIFYKCSINYYNKYLLNRYHEVNDRKDFSLENRMFAPIVRYGYKPFTTHPNYIGYCAGTGKLYGTDEYPSGVKERAREFMFPL
jgi:hypothetical protein